MKIESTAFTFMLVLVFIVLAIVAFELAIALASEVGTKLAELPLGK